MEQIVVSSAIILRENSGIKEVLITQRGYGELKGGWEFPGGKLEPCETPEQCVVREIREELAIEVKAERTLGVIDYGYPRFHLVMYCIICTIITGELRLLEHKDAKWINKETLHSVELLPADRLILDKIEAIL